MIERDTGKRRRPARLSAPRPVLVAGSDIEVPVSELESLARAARQQPVTRGRSSTPSKLWRWSRDGRLGADGVRIYLRTVQYGGTTMTSAAWLAAFVRELTASRDRAAADSESDTARQRDRASAVDAALESAGLVPDDDTNPQPRGRGHS